MYKLYNGDCLGVMDNLIKEGTRVDAIITDPPYGTTSCAWDVVIPFDKMWKRLNLLIKDNCPIVLFGSQPFTSQLICSNIDNYKHYWIWDKEICGAFALAKKRPMIVTEEICIFGKNKQRVNYFPIMEKALDKNIRPLNKGSKSSDATPVSSGIARSDINYNPKERYPKNIRVYSKYSSECNQLNRVHPTQKPVALMEYLVKTYTQENETVLDFTMGSGSTGVACCNCNRNFIGIELEKKYYDIAEKRIKEADTSIFDI